MSTWCLLGMPRAERSYADADEEPGMVAVQIEGKYGYIPEDQVERFKTDHPEATVIR